MLLIIFVSLRNQNSRPTWRQFRDTIVLLPSMFRSEAGIVHRTRRDVFIGDFSALHTQRCGALSWKQFTMALDKIQFSFCCALKWKLRVEDGGIIINYFRENSTFSTSYYRSINFTFFYLQLKIFDGFILACLRISFSTIFVANSTIAEMCCKFSNEILGNVGRHKHATSYSAGYTREAIYNRMLASPLFSGFFFSIS